jgi:hypothetical protein
MRVATGFIMDGEEYQGWETAEGSKSYQLDAICEVLDQAIVWTRDLLTYEGDVDVERVVNRAQTLVDMLPKMQGRGAEAGEAPEDKPWVSISSMLEQLMQRMDRMESAAKEPPNRNTPMNTNIQQTPAPPKTTPRNPTTPVAERRKAPVAAHHPCRLVLKVDGGVRETTRKDPARVVSEINKVLQQSESSKQLLVVSIKFTDNGNAVIFLREDQNAKLLMPFVPQFMQIVAGEAAAQAQLDEKWYKVHLTGIDTGAYTTGTGEIYSSEQVHRELKRNNPGYANIPESVFTQKPRWLRMEAELKIQNTSSVTFAVNDEEVYKRLMAGRVLAAFGRFGTLYAYTDKPPATQCRNCWSFEHTTPRCTRTKRCRICAGDHGEAEHYNACSNCSMADTECTHRSPARCANCPEPREGEEHTNAHYADWRQCPARLAKYGNTMDGTTKKSTGWKTTGRGRRKGKAPAPQARVQSDAPQTGNRWQALDQSELSGLEKRYPGVDAAIIRGIYDKHDGDMQRVEREVADTAGSFTSFSVVAQ